MSKDYLKVKGAKEHNLKNISVDIPKNKFFDITDIMDLVLKRGGNLVYKPISGYWIDIGSKSDYKRAKEFINHLN